MESILITGLNGFLARSLSEQLADSGFRIIGLIREKAESSIYFSNVVLYENIEEVFINEANITFIFHFAAYIPYSKFSKADINLYLSNIKLTGQIVELFPSSRIIFASSVSVYGIPSETPIKVDSAFNKPDLYGMSKLAGEAILANHSSYAIIRFSSIVGKGMKPTSFIPKAILQAKKSQRIQLWGTGQRLQNYIDISDAVALSIRCAYYKKNIITLGVSAKSYSNKKVAEIICDSLNVTIEYEGEDSSPSFVYDPSIEYRDLGFEPSISLEQTIGNMTI